MPEQPAKVHPSQPVAPAQPERPVTPEQPVALEKPVQQEEAPAMPEQPVEPVAPGGGGSKMQPDAVHYEKVFQPRQIIEEDGNIQSAIPRTL